MDYNYSGFIIEKSESNHRFWVTHKETGVVFRTSFKTVRNIDTLERLAKKYYNISNVEEVPDWYWFQLKRKAEKRNINFNLKKDLTWELYLSQDRKCFLTGVPIKFSPSRNHRLCNTASLDRIDSKKGYMVGNIQWVHKDLNRMKNHFSQEYFLDVCNKVANNFKLMGEK